MKRVHITLNSSVLDDPKKLESIKREIVDAAGLTDVNEKRLERYGILTGNLDAAKVPFVSEMKEVDSVDVDEQRQTK